MNSHHLRNKIGRILIAFAFMVGIGIVSSTAVQAQYPQGPYGQGPYGQDPYRNRDYRRNDRYGNISQIAINQGYQDGLYTGSSDAQRGQNYNPQRSHFYRNGHGSNNGYGRMDNTYQFQQAYRSGFLRGYQEGYQRYGGGYNRRNNGRYGRWPF